MHQGAKDLVEKVAATLGLLADELFAPAHCPLVRPARARIVERHQLQSGHRRPDSMSAFGRSR